MIALRKGHFCGVPADKGVLLHAVVSAGLQMNFFFVFFLIYWIRPAVKQS